MPLTEEEKQAREEEFGRIHENLSSHGNNPNKTSSTSRYENSIS